MQPQLADPSRRLIGLDVLRFVAVTLVLHVHALLGFGQFPSGEPSGFLGRLLDVIPPGMHGVDLFFVLSGFLVAGLFFKELSRTGTVSVGRFLIRRGFKIYPPFWLLILVTVAFQHRQTGSINWRGLLAELGFVQNYLAGLWPHTWSLAVEEHFYLILAGLFFLLKRRAGADGTLSLRTIPRVFGVLVLSCLMARILTWWFDTGGGLEVERWLVSVTHVRLDALFFGVWLAYFWYRRWDDGTKAKLLAYRPLWAVLGLLLISPLSLHFVSVPVWRVIGFNVVYAGAGCLLLAALSLDAGRVPAWCRGLAWLGRHSYSVYLWHLLVLEWMRPVLGAQSSGPGVFLMKEGAYFVGSWLCGVLAARVVEFPTLRLRDRLFPAKG
ncbi:MAG TPA: acyltransferase [Verrucomicrobiae bacterium]